VLRGSWLMDFSEADFNGDCNYQQIDFSCYLYEFILCQMQRITYNNIIIQLFNLLIDFLYIRYFNALRINFDRSAAVIYREFL
jgi:hypothetical protein